MKFAISGEALGKVNTLFELCGILKKVGIHAIELWPENIPVLPGKELIHYRLYRNRDIGRAVEILHEQGVSAPSLSFGAGFDQALADDAKLYAAEMAYAVEVAHEVGAKLVNHYCYHVCMNDPVDMDKLLTYYTPAIETAEKLGVTIVLENEAHDVTRTPQGMLDIVTRIGSSHFKTNFDATNYYQAGFEGYPFSYNLLKPVIGYVHIKNGCVYTGKDGQIEDCKGGYMTGAAEGHDIYYPLAGDGAVNIEGLLRRLEQDGYDGYCTLEPHTTPELCLEYYRGETDYLKMLGYLKSDESQKRT